jgi:hypothetical protein
MKNTILVIILSFFFLSTIAQSVELKGKISFWVISTKKYNHLEPNLLSNLLEKEYGNIEELSVFLKSIPDTFEMVSIQDENIKLIPSCFFNFKHLKGVDIYAPKISIMDSGFCKMDSLISLKWTSNTLISLPLGLARLKKLTFIHILSKRIGKNVKKQAQVIVKETKSPYLAISINERYEINTEDGIIYYH